MRKPLSDTVPISASGCLVSLKGVFFSIEGKDILKGLDLRLRHRRIAVVGRNGSGKSTLARVLAGLVDAQNGTVEIDGVAVAKDRKAALRTVGILFQNPDHQIIFPTVIEEMMFGLTQLGHSKPAAEEAAKRCLGAFGKSHWADTHVASLSQGQKHLLCLMAIAAMGPKLLILDEPYTGLDIPTKMQLKRYLAQYDGAILHISHDPADLADYEAFVWIEDGQIAAQGKDPAILNDYVQRMNELGALDDLSDLSR